MNFHSMFTKILTDKIQEEKDRETNQQTSLAVVKTERQEFASSAASCGFLVASAHNLPPPTSRILQPKIDATDRRNIEALNEDKSHTTKEELDEIKRVHQKEKIKKEEDNIESHQFTAIEGSVRKIISW